MGEAGAGRNEEEKEIKKEEMSTKRSSARLMLAGLLIVLLASACSVRRFIPTDEKLLKETTVELKATDARQNLEEVQAELEELLRPEANGTFLGMRPGLLVYYKSQREKPGFLNKYLNKKIGEAPVYLSAVDSSRTMDLMENRLENNGFFDASIHTAVVPMKKLATVKYTVKAGKAYTLQEYDLDTGSLSIYTELRKAMEETLILPGSRFNLDKLKAERERIDDYLKGRGYYNFNADFLIFEADTNQYEDRRYDLFLRFKENVPKKYLLPYALNEINVYPDYSLTVEGQAYDTVKYQGINFIQNPVYFKPKRMAPYILFEKGQPYDPFKSRLTSSRLSSIGAYKFVNIRYERVDTVNAQTDSLRLNANIFLSPLKKRSIRTELRAVTKSNGFAGPSLAVVYSNRNLYKGGETFNLTGKFGYELQLGGGNNQGLSSTQFGFEADIIFPRLLLPFRVTHTFLYAVPKTKLSLGYDFFDRGDLYRLNSLNGTLGYSWRKTRSVYHEVNPVSISYLNTSNITDDFQAILDQNTFLESSFQEQLIMGLTYNFVYNQLAENKKKHPILVVANFDVAGNALDLVSNNTNADGQKTLLGIAYAQYVKGDVNFVYNLRMRRDRQLVARLFSGVGLPYGNSESLPFAKQYFSGGPSSVRAFRTRSLGPGSYNPVATDQGAFFDRSGDIRLEANLEYRFPIYSYLKGALFADAGNVWLINENSALPGGKFSSEFINELGMGVGAGVRLDVQNFVIRLDMSTPIRRPYLPEGSRSGFDLKDALFNFAIGYPF
ncbi:MAG: BamA/TamA family outer membrane protein [Roseivirga sp.]